MSAIKRHDFILIYLQSLITVYCAHNWQTSMTVMIPIVIDMEIDLNEDVMKFALEL
jgi:hypothetical protein